jgi:hypothetical protein
MGPRAGFDNGMAGGCTPFVGLTWLISESSYERIHHLLPMPAQMGQFHGGCSTSVCLSPAHAPNTRDTVAYARIRLRVRSFRFWGIKSFLRY